MWLHEYARGGYSSVSVCLEEEEGEGEGEGGGGGLVNKLAYLILN